MTSFPLEIISMDGVKFKGEVVSISLRGMAGDLMILGHHTDFCTAVGMSTAKIVLPDESVRYGACIGGMLSMVENRCRLYPTTFEWSEEIDEARAASARDKAENALLAEELPEESRNRMNARHMRALIRLQTAEKNKK